MKLLLEKVDDIHQEAYKMNKWTMQVSKQQQEKSKYIHQRVIWFEIENINVLQILLLEVGYYFITLF